MLIFLQEIALQLFLWLLQLIDGLMEIFSAISGVATVNYHGQQVNIIEFVIGDSTVGAIFWCIFITAVGLTCIFTIVGLVKNMVANNRTVSTIVGKFFLALLGTMAMLAVVFNACVADWVNGYSASNMDVTSLSVSKILGGYDTALFGIWPTSWKCNGMVNPNTFMYLPALIAGIALTIALIIAVLNLAKRVYEIVFTYFTMPISMSTLPLDDGARFKNWREMFVTKIVLAYGAVLAVNIFALLLPLINQMHIDGVSGFANAMFTLFMIVGGAMIIPAGQTLFARLFGQADDMRAGGGWLRSAFYGGRIASALTVGLAMKGVRGIGHAIRRRSNRSHNSGDSGNSGDSSADDSSDQYTESGSEGGAPDGGTETSEGGESS